MNIQLEISFVNEDEQTYADAHNEHPRSLRLIREISIPIPLDTEVHVSLNRKLLVLAIESNVYYQDENMLIQKCATELTDIPLDDFKKLGRENGWMIYTTFASKQSLK